MSEEPPVASLPIAWTPWQKWPWLNCLCGYINLGLIRFSEWYMRYWLGIQNPRRAIYELPFGLLIKSCRYGVNDECEARGTMMAHAMGLPVPRILCYGQSGPDEDKTILMTRIPGETLEDVYQSYSEEELDVIMAEVAACLERKRAFAGPHGTAVCGLDGQCIENMVLPLCKYDRKESPREFHQSLTTWRETDGLLDPDLEELKKLVRKLEDKEYWIVFGHGDLAPRNIMVKDGHLSGIIDWEFSGWYPEYWDYVNPLAIFGPDCQQEQQALMLKMPGCERFREERQAWDNLGILNAPWFLP